MPNRHGRDTDASLAHLAFVLIWATDEKGMPCPPLVNSPERASTHVISAEKRCGLMMRPIRCRHAHDVTAQSSRRDPMGRYREPQYAGGSLTRRST